MTTFWAPSIDRLHDSQIAVTLGIGALEVLGHEDYCIATTLELDRSYQVE